MSFYIYKYVLYFLGFIKRCANKHIPKYIDTSSKNESACACTSAGTSWCWSLVLVLVPNVIQTSSKRH